MPGVRQCWMCLTSVQDYALSSHQNVKHDLSTVIAICFTLPRFTEERSFLRVRDDWKLSPPHLHAPQLTEDDMFVIEDDMDSDTAAESNLSLKSHSFLNRVNNRVGKMLNRSPEDPMQDIGKRSMLWGMFMSSTVEAFVFMRKNFSDNLHSIKNTRENLT